MAAILWKTRRHIVFLIMSTLLILHVAKCFEETWKYMHNPYHLSTQRWYRKLNYFFMNVMNFLSYMINTTAVDDLVTQGAWTSAANALAKLSVVILLLPFGTIMVCKGGYWYHNLLYYMKPKSHFIGIRDENVYHPQLGLGLIMCHLTQG